MALIRLQCLYESVYLALCQVWFYFTDYVNFLLKFIYK